MLMSLAPGGLDQALRCDYLSCGYWERVPDAVSVDYDDPAWILMRRGWMIERVNETVVSICPQHAKQDDARYYAFKQAASTAQSGFEYELFRSRLAHETYALQQRRLQQDTFPYREQLTQAHSDNRRGWESFARAYATSRPTPAPRPDPRLSTRPNPANSALEGMLKQYADHQLLSDLATRPVTPSKPVKYAQGMARGYYRDGDGFKGRHPGYITTLLEDPLERPSRRTRRKLQHQETLCSLTLVSSS